MMFSGYNPCEAYLHVPVRNAISVQDLEDGNDLRSVKHDCGKVEVGLAL